MIKEMRIFDGEIIERALKRGKVWISCHAPHKRFLQFSLCLLVFFVPRGCLRENFFNLKQAFILQRAHNLNKPLHYLHL